MGSTLRSISTATPRAPGMRSSRLGPRQSRFRTWGSLPRQGRTTSTTSSRTRWCLLRSSPSATARSWHTCLTATLSTITCRASCTCWTRPSCQAAPPRGSRRIRSSSLAPTSCTSTIRRRMPRGCASSCGCPTPCYGCCASRPTARCGSARPRWPWASRASGLFSQTWRARSSTSPARGSRMCSWTPRAATRTPPGATCCGPVAPSSPSRWSAWRAGWPRASATRSGAGRRWW
mmetsp:Transcript_24125/g.75708  ORF Transcript_24125/g.75708 Transcript_24125/m.75708 type:complete len:233 (-) Transcript_24125:345-1043(-)